MNAKDRVVDELGSLREKIESLELFLTDILPKRPMFPIMQRDLLEAQLHVMKAYAKILELRLKCWID